MLRNKFRDLRTRIEAKASQDHEWEVGMALIHCPECGKEVSDKAGSCPNCGHPINGEKPQEKKPSLKTGSIIGLIGGASFIFIIVLSLSGLLSGQQEETPDVTATIETNSSALLGDIAAACCIAATVLFIIGLAMGSRLSRKAAIGVSVAALVLSAIALVGIALYYNVLMICIGWLFLWEPALEVVGSVKMLTAALKFEDA